MGYLGREESGSSLVNACSVAGGFQKTPLRALSKRHPIIGASRAPLPGSLGDPSFEVQEICEQTSLKPGFL
jgi:hypothetical protein